MADELVLLPPHPDRWEDGYALEMHPEADGYVGRITLKGRTYLWIRHGIKQPNGAMPFQGQHASDAEFEGVMAALTGVVEG